MLFNEVGFLDRFDAAARAGFTGVEYLFPYDFDAGDTAGAPAASRVDAGAAQPSGRQLGRRRTRHRLSSGSRNGNSPTASIAPSTMRSALGCTQLNCLAGIVPPGVSQVDAHATFVGNLRLAAPKLGAAGSALLIEPINTRDIPGFFLTHTHAGARDHRRGRLPTTCSCSTTSITCRSWKATSPRRSSATCRGSRTCRSPIRPRATNPARAKSTTASC